MQQSRAPHLSIVMPCWNEADGIVVALATAVEAAETARRDGEIGDWRIIAVDDGSTDATPALLAAAAEADPRIIPVTHPNNRGLGAAVRSGLDAASADLVLYTDADMPCDLVTDLPRALRLLRTRSADVVAAYRRTRTGEGPRRLVYSAAYNALARASFGLTVRDVNFACKLVTRRVLEAIPLKSEGSFIDVELVARASAAGFRIVQFGTDYFPRTRGVSTLSSPATIAKIVQEMVTVGRDIRRSSASHVAEHDARLLVVNADDYGLTEGISEGILRAHESGIVTSTSVLTVAPGFASASRWLGDHESLGVGAHLAVVGEDPPLLGASEIPTLVDRRGRLAASWRVFLGRAAAGRIDPADLEREFRAQLSALRRARVRVTHLDTHQHLHLWPAVGDVILKLAVDEAVPAVRVPRSGAGPKGRAINRLASRLADRLTDAGLAHPDWAAGLDEAGHMHGEQLRRAVAALARRQGHVELSCHPGDPSDAARYRWRYDWDRELAALVSTDARRWVDEAGFTLGSYGDLAGTATA